MRPLARSVVIFKPLIEKKSNCDRSVTRFTGERGGLCAARFTREDKNNSFADSSFGFFFFTKMVLRS